jgi:hypothetical protein
MYMHDVTKINHALSCSRQCQRMNTDDGEVCVVASTCEQCAGAKDEDEADVSAANKPEGNESEDEDADEDEDKAEDGDRTSSDADDGDGRLHAHGETKAAFGRSGRCRCGLITQNPNLPKKQKISFHEYQ